MTVYLRSASLTNYAALARGLGLDPLAMLARVGLPAACLDDADLRIPAEALMRLLELSAQLSGEQAFGLRLAETRRLSTFGLVGMLVRDEPVLREAVSTLTRYGKLHNEAVSVVVEEGGGIAVLRLDFLPVPGAGRQGVELGVGAVYRVLRIFLGAEWSPRAVNFIHPAPSSLAVHHRLFGRRVHFSQEFDGIVVTSADLDTPIAQADPVMRGYARQMLSGASPVDRMKTRYEVQQLILALLPTGRCTADQVAQHMGVDRRTVHRRLAQERCNFSQLVHLTRVDLAQRHLRGGQRTLTEVAHLLGFESLSAFSRWRRQAMDSGLLVASQST